MYGSPKLYIGCWSLILKVKLPMFDAQILDRLTKTGNTLSLALPIRIMSSCNDTRKPLVHFHSVVGLGQKLVRTGKNLGCFVATWTTYIQSGPMMANRL